MSQNTSNVSSEPSSKIKLIVSGVVTALVIAAILYGIGLSKGRAQLTSQKAGYDTQIQTLQVQLDTSKQELVSSQNLTLLMQARANLYRTALDLERRNFGTANTHLQESAATLAGVKKGVNMKMEELDALQKAISKTNINVAVDLESQRKQVLAFATQLESLTPASEPVTVSRN